MEEGTLRSGVHHSHATGVDLSGGPGERAGGKCEGGERTKGGRAEVG